LDEKHEVGAASLQFALEPEGQAGAGEIARHAGFDESVFARLDLSDLTLVRINTSPIWTVPASDLALSYDRSTDTATLTFAGLPGGTLPDGDYQLSINATGVSDLAGNAMSNDVTLNFFVLKGDLNRDGQVSISDLITLASNFGKTSATYADGDLNYDGEVSISDFIDMAANFSQVSSSTLAAAAPQPAADLMISAPTSTSTQVFWRNGDKSVPATCKTHIPARHTRHHSRKRHH